MKNCSLVNAGFLFTAGAAILSLRLSKGSYVSAGHPGSQPWGTSDESLQATRVLSRHSQDTSAVLWIEVSPSDVVMRTSKISVLVAGMLVWRNEVAGEVVDAAIARNGSAVLGVHRKIVRPKEPGRSPVAQSELVLVILDANGSVVNEHGWPVTKHGNYHGPELPRVVSIAAEGNGEKFVCILRGYVNDRLSDSVVFGSLAGGAIEDSLAIDMWCRRASDIDLVAAVDVVPGAPLILITWVARTASRALHCGDRVEMFSYDGKLQWSSTVESKQGGASESNYIQGVRVHTPSVARHFVLVNASTHAEVVFSLSRAEESWEVKRED